MPPLDLTPYYNAALASGQVKSSSYSMSGSANVVIPGGIMYVIGDFSYSGSGDIVGSIIATGKISISGSCDLTATNGYPLLVSKESNIDISGSGDYTGLIMAQTGNFSKSGSGFVKGSIVVNGTFDASGSWGALIYQDVTPTVPGGGGGGGGTNSPTDKIGVDAWYK